MRAPTRDRTASLRVAGFARKRTSHCESDILPSCRSSAALVRKRRTVARKRRFLRRPPGRLVKSIAARRARESQGGDAGDHDDREVSVSRKQERVKIVDEGNIGGWRKRRVRSISKAIARVSCCWQSSLRLHRFVYRLPASGIPPRNTRRRRSWSCARLKRTRQAEFSIRPQWVPYSGSPVLKRAVSVTEKPAFFDHDGTILDEIKSRRAELGGREFARAEPSRSSSPRIILRRANRWQVKELLTRGGSRRRSASSALRFPEHDRVGEGISAERPRLAHT